MSKGVRTILNNPDWFVHRHHDTFSGVTARGMNIDERKLKPSSVLKTRFTVRTQRHIRERDNPVTNNLGLVNISRGELSGPCIE